MKVVGNKKINITDKEYEYYLQLVERFTEENGDSGEMYFVNLFDTDDNGFITLIRTEKSIPWAVLFFVQQVMINQRLRVNDALARSAGKILDRIEDLERRVQDIEPYIKPIGS